MFNLGINSVSTHKQYVLNTNFWSFDVNNSNGIVFLYDTAVGKSSPVVSNAGTIDYVTGKVDLSAINIQTIISGNTYIDIYAEIDEIDVTPAKGQILQIESTDVLITMIKEIV